MFLFLIRRLFASLCLRWLLHLELRFRFRHRLALGGLGVFRASLSTASTAPSTSATPSASTTATSRFFLAGRGNALLFLASRHDALLLFASRRHTLLSICSLGLGNGRRRSPLLFVHPRQDNALRRCLVQRNQSRPAS
jgi:hypothetical protein